MTASSQNRLSRRELMRAIATYGLGTAALGSYLSGCRQLGEAQREAIGVHRDALDGKPRFLIVIGASGGASIIDSFLAVRQSEAGTNAATLNTFADSQVSSIAGSSFRAVSVQSSSLGSIPIPVNSGTVQADFVNRYKDDMLVATTVGTSVNHAIAQRRSTNGNGAWRGRTLQECVALQFGSSVPLPNVSMGSGGYSERGLDDSLPTSCFAEPVPDPLVWPIGLDGVRGQPGALDRDALALARSARNSLDAQSVFGRTFENSAALKRWVAQRSTGLANIESSDLITKLNLLPNLPPQFPLAQFGLSSSPDLATVASAFPLYISDPLQSQAAMAYLLIKNRVSTAITLGPDLNAVITGALSSTTLRSPPLAFDFSHNDHRAGQAFMWSRILSTVDTLIGLLKAAEFDPVTHESFWDRTLIYVATDFGRTRVRPSGSTSFGTGHDLNNGVLLISPLVKGNTILGGVDPLTTLTYGFDARTGQAQVGKVTSNEADIFAGVLTAMGVDTSGSGLPDASAFKV